MLNSIILYYMLHFVNRTATLKKRKEVWISYFMIIFHDIFGCKSFVMGQIVFCSKKCIVYCHKKCPKEVNFYGAKNESDISYYNGSKMGKKLKRILKPCHWIKEIFLILVVVTCLKLFHWFPNYLKVSKCLFF